MKDGQLTKLLRLLAIGIALPCLYGSAKLSVAGVNLGGDLWWMGWVLACAFTLSQFIVNGSYENELNWTILALGIGAYTASIWMNILGIYDYRLNNGTHADFWYIYNNFDLGIILLAIFIDAFPEMALRWAMGESKVGDMIGNLVKTAKNPLTLTKSLTVTQTGFKSEPHRNTGTQRREELQKRYAAPTRDDDMDEEEEPSKPKMIQRKPVSPIFR